MNSNAKRLSCAEVNRMDLVEYLSRLGIQAVRMSGHHYWYLSPFRAEQTASFKVNKKLNAWYDFGEGKGGTLIDFGIRYFMCSVSKFLQQSSFSFSPVQRPMAGEEKEKENNESTILVKKVTTLASSYLLAYVKSRKIDIEIGKKWCKEISFTLHGKTYSASGFVNDSGGYELRNSFFKGSSHPKDITTVQKGAQSLAVFEGFFDFLSYSTLR